MSFPSDDHSSELRDLFFESAEEILQGMNEAGLALEEHPGDAEQLRHVRRAVHTLKGDSAACGYRQLSELAHEFEDVLTPELAQQHAGSIAEVILTAADTFHEMLAAYRSTLQPPSGEALRERIASLLQKPEPEAQNAESEFNGKFDWTEYERLLMADAIRNGESLYNLAVHLNPQAPLPAAAFELARKAVESAGKVLAWRPEGGAYAEKTDRIEVALSSAQTLEWIRAHCQVPSSVDELLIERVEAPNAVPRDLLDILLESEAAAISSGIKGTAAEPGPSAEDDSREPAASAGIAHAAENSLRVDATRIDTVMNLVGEMIIGKSMLQRAIAEFERRHTKDPLRAKLSDALAFQSRVLGELQKSVMKIRMVPVEQLFRRFPRIVRDVARLRNKDIGVEMAGQTTDLDKGILDALAEPLAHLVRNAADHGIEGADERHAAGKPVRGTIRLNAYHDGDEVVIEVADDGHGLDREKIVRRAIERGIITPQEALRLNETECLQLIFAAGLSTADEVTEISGRGVGLDVVKSGVEALKGSVELQSKPGQGTTFRISVPLTLASIQALLFRVNERMYAVPIASVGEITRISEEEVHCVDNHEVFQLRDEVLTLVRLGCLERFAVPLAHAASKRVFVIVISAAGRRFGLAVDSLVGEEELVIKALEDELVNSPLVSGASILGDGTVVLILNVPAVISHLSRIPALGATA
ncbi:MAG TPA: chemotaxis protein CheA [Candidatus Dormibacteraeota bacterium]|nr:chemotaxis protein CheA [Candidatus Dormibacteraeota bacterium]